MPVMTCIVRLPSQLYFLTFLLSATFFFFFFNDTATTEIYTLSLHDALPIFRLQPEHRADVRVTEIRRFGTNHDLRSEEHTSELQSHHDLVCRLLLEKKKKKKKQKQLTKKNTMTTSNTTNIMTNRLSTENNSK